ncbi:MAG TPA: ribose 5-phosphate isomerase A [Acidimicrobiales bacterium]|nr:ribose 5-phosphate isomerase A [Acidimicrobiales bacterium]
MTEGAEPKAALAETEKRLAAEASSLLVADGMKVGLGTGSTVAYLLPALAARRLDITCVATSVRTEAEARRLGLDVVSFSGSAAEAGPGGGLAHLDIAIDGSDQVTPDLWLIKGGGGAHTREKIVARAADRFVVIVSSEKLVERLSPPVPLELLSFGLKATMRALGELGECRLRDCPPSPDGGVIADYFGPIADRRALAEHFEATPGVVGHGLFPPEMVATVLVGHAGAAVEELVARPS